jgi:hypothetical protein
VQKYHKEIETFTKEQDGFRLVVGKNNPWCIECFPVKKKKEMELVVDHCCDYIRHQRLGCPHHWTTWKHLMIITSSAQVCRCFHQVQWRAP